MTGPLLSSAWEEQRGDPSGKCQLLPKTEAEFEQSQRLRPGGDVLISSPAAAYNILSPTLRTASALPKPTQARERKQSRGKCPSAHSWEGDPGALGLEGANKSRIFSCSSEHPQGAWPWHGKSSLAAARGEVPQRRCAGLAQPSRCVPGRSRCAAGLLIGNERLQETLTSSIWSVPIACKCCRAATLREDRVPHI